MRLKDLKNISKGKSKDKKVEARDSIIGIGNSSVYEMEEHMNERTKDLEAMTKRLKELSNKNIYENTASGPHGPIGELAVESDMLSDTDLELGESSEIILEDDNQDVKMVEIGTITSTSPAISPTETSTEPELTTQHSAESDINLEDDSDSLRNLFSDDEEEENPLEKLINSLPDVSTRELLDDLNEIKGIIRDWQQS